MIGTTGNQHEGANTMIASTTTSNNETFEQETVLEGEDEASFLCSSRSTTDLLTKPFPASSSSPPSTDHRIERTSSCATVPTGSLKTYDIATLSKVGFDTLIGKQVRKLFDDNEYYEGEIISYNYGKNWFKVRYEDGEKEDLTIEEILEIIID